MKKRKFKESKRLKSKGKPTKTEKKMVIEIFSVNKIQY
jgi:hypothetical protein